MPVRKRTTARPRATRASESPDTAPLAFVPTRVFFVNGTGVDKEERVATQRAMWQAGVGECNLVKVSSVIAPGCRIIPAEEGRQLLQPGNMVFAVIAMAKTDEPHQRVATAVAWAKPEKAGVAGYIAEVEEDLAKGKTAATAADEAGCEALAIMAGKLGVSSDPSRVWSRRRRTVTMGRTTVHIGSMAAECVAPEEQDGERRTAVAFVAAIYL
jgi:arginine decarboxylase